MFSEPTRLPEVVKIQEKRHEDARGYFAETFKNDWFTANIAEEIFVQENQSLSKVIGTIRGLHFQTNPFAQGKLVRCVVGALLDIAVDIRKGSPTYGQWVAEELTAQNGTQLWVPTGFAHGFCTLVPDTVISYKVTAPYSPENDKGLSWDDAAIGIDWPSVANPETLSPKDSKQPLLRDLPDYFSYSAKEPA